ncbi:MAG: dienelactone hydrolase family protein [Phycisphaerales bacterium]
MHTETLDYRDGELVCEGFIAAADTAAGAKRPAVLVAHAWAGQDDFARDKARMLAQLGYVGFALDIYGKGRRGNSPQENSALMQPFVDDRRLIRRRLHAAVAAASAHRLVDPQRIAAIGFCFGGMCVLDLARSALPAVRGVVSFHGLLGAPGIAPQPPITAKVLVLHPYDDPMATPDHVRTLATELTQAKADWQIHMYGHTLHAFTNPQANDPGSGLRHDPKVARRAFASMEAFLAEALGAT